MGLRCPKSAPASPRQTSAGVKFPSRAQPFARVHLQTTLLSWRIINTRNFRATAIWLGPGVLTSYTDGEGFFFLGQNCRIKLLTARVPNFINVGFKNTIQAGIHRNCIVPLRVLIFVNNNTGLWSDPEKKKKILEMLPEERRRLGELTGREKAAPENFQQKLNK